VYKIAIVGASTLLGRELKEALSESPLAAANFLLLDEDDALGTLDQVGDEVTFIQPIGPDSFEKADFTFFCGPPDLTRKHWKQALVAGSSVIDLSGALDQEVGVLVRAPWVGADAGSADLFTPAIIPAHPAALVLALLMERVQNSRTGAVGGGDAAGAGKRVWPRSDGRTASADSEPAELSNAAACDLRRADSLQPALGPGRECDSQPDWRRSAGAPSFWEPGGESLVFADVSGDSGACVSRACVFDCGGTGATGGDFALEDALSGDHLDLVLEDTDSPSNLAATGQNDVLVRLRQDPGARNPAQASKIWLWVASDNLRLYAQNAVECALELRRLRPQGTVQ
jgi:aspartate-semialdehyde dehydrogenase